MTLYNYKVEYKKGSENKAAHALFRVFSINTKGEKIFNKVYLTEIDRTIVTISKRRERETPTENENSEWYEKYIIAI